MAIRLMRWWGACKLPTISVILPILFFAACGESTPDVGSTAAGSTVPATETTLPVATATTPQIASTEPADADTSVVADHGSTPEDMTPEPVPRFITAETAPGVFAMEVGQTSTLVLPLQTAPPRVDGTALLAIEVISASATNVAEWELRAVEAGNATLTVSFAGDERVWHFIVE